MLNKIKTLWTESKVTIIAAALALAYLIGIKRGKNEEKAHQTDTLLANVARANRARDSLGDADTVRRLHDKYRRRQ